MYFLYNILLFMSLVVLVPYYGLKMAFTGKYRKSIGPKLGRIHTGTVLNLQGNPRIWVHAVSVGEVTAAAPIIKEIRERLPQSAIILSTSTETGQEMARKISTGIDSLIYYPLDFPPIVRKLISLIQPNVFVAVETEIWPNFMRICRKRGVEVLIVNGRISPRSYRGYSRTRFFWKRVLGLTRIIGAISEIDAERLRLIGVPDSKIRVLGNAKMDSLAARVDLNLKEKTSVQLSIPSEAKVFVAGSTHEGEEKVVLEVYSRLLKLYPDFLLIMVPRHIERGEEVIGLAREAGFTDCITMKEIMAGKSRRDERVIVVDVIGELFKIYSLATLVFCGGSLVPRGGQNILEPAAWGKVVFYGPFMDDFLEEKALLEKTGSGIVVRDGDELLAKVLELIQNPGVLLERGIAGGKAIASSRGAAERYAKLIIEAARRENMTTS